MSRRARSLLVCLVGGGGVLVFLLPLALMLLPNPRPQLVHALAAQPTGVYLGVGDSVYRVFPCAEPPRAFPADAATVPKDTIVLVRYRNLGSPAGYSLRRYPSGAELPVTREVRASQQVLELHPASLPAGRYYVTKTREGMWGGTDYVYFRVADPAAALR